MRALALAAVLFGGCSFDNSGVGLDDADVPDASVFDGMLAPPDGSAVDADPAMPDAEAADAAVPDAVPAPDAPGILFGYTPSNFSPSSLTPSGDILLDCGTSVFNSTSLTFSTWCGQPEPTPMVANGMVILATTRLEIASGSQLRLIGNKPVIVAVFGDAIITGTVNARGAGVNPGAGGSSSALCGTNAAPTGIGIAGQRSGNNGGGGGGGGFGTDGADGGAGASGGILGGKGVEGGNVTLVPLRGGCSGGPGGESDTQSGGLGGAGGGGVQLSVAGTLTITGTVTASGGGGRGAAQRAGAGGGGSGGGVLLEGNVVALDGAALTANGGGGGEGGANTSGSVNANGDNGLIGSNTAAPGGSGDSSSGGDGGNGGAGSTLPTAGSPGQSGDGGGGGGGGAVGRIRINAASMCTLNGTQVLSPAPTSSGTNCP